MYHRSETSLDGRSAELLNITARIRTARDIINTALRTANRPIVTTKFGPQSAVLLHMATRLMPDIKVVWVDTGLGTDATRRYGEQLTELFDLNLEVIRSEANWSGPIPEAD
ncbi:MAG: phosphoadenosine phosphosulfate reductase family protein, partial [Pseudomonadota bacterium]